MTSDARLLFRSYSVSVPAESVEGLLTGPDLSGIPAVPDSSIPVVRVVKGSAADSRALDPDWRRRREAALSSSNPRVLLGLLRDDCASVRLAAASNPAVLTVPVGMTEAAWEDRFTEVFRLAECGEGPASLDELLEALSLAVRRSTSTAPASVQWLVDEARTAGEAAGGAGLFRLETEDGILPVRDAGTAARILIDATEDLEAERRDALLLELASVPAACVRREVCWTDGLPEVVLDTLMKDPRSDIRRLVADILKLLLVDEILKFFRADPELAELAAPALHESDNADEWAAWYADSDDPSVREAWEALENDSMASMNDDVFYDALARSPGPKAA